MKKSLYQQTADVYNKLGRKYLIDSQKLTPVERLSFAEQFSKGAHILDAGCGGGRDAKFFLKRGFLVTGTDLSSVLIDAARKDNPKGTFICEDILKSKFPGNSFDGVWAQAILLHLKRNDVPKAIKNFYKVLKPGGLMHIRVKKGTGEKFVKEELSGWNERFYTFFSKKEM